MRIAVVNNAATAVEALRRVIALDHHEVAWVATNGAEAVTQCARDLPDLVLMDLPLPQMDGVETTRQIMKQTPCPILVVTAAVEKNASKVFQAMGHGALDAVNTPALGLDGSAADAQALLGKIDTIGRLSGKSRRRSDGISRTKITEQSRDQFRPQSERMQQSSSGSLAGTLGSVPPLIAIGCSTGGPMALANILSALPADFKAAIAIIQHVDAQFSSGMATWLDNQTPLSVELAAEGNRLRAGKVLIAGTNDHLVLKRSLALTYTPEPKDYPYRPSVDAFFRSAAQYWPQPATAVLLTGMGRDGADGLGLLRDRGWHTIAQDQASSAVYGMPKAAVERGAAVDVLPLTAIAPALMRRAARNS